VDYIYWSWKPLETKVVNEVLKKRASRNDSNKEKAIDEIQNNRSGNRANTLDGKVV